MTSVNEIAIEYNIFMTRRRNFLIQLDKLRKDTLSIDDLYNNRDNNILLAEFLANMTNLETTQFMVLLNRVHARIQSKTLEEIKGTFSNLIDIIERGKING